MSTLFNLFTALLTVGVVYYLKGVMMATKDELVAQLNVINESLTKVSAETTALNDKVAELQEALDNSDNVPEDVMTLVSDIRARVQSIDDQVTDTAPSDPTNPVEPNPVP